MRRPSKTFVTRWGTGCVTVFLLIVLPGNVVFAQSTPDSLTNRVATEKPFYDPNASCSTGAGASGITINVGNATWNSGLQPPYYLEEFAINTLQDLAQATNTPVSSTVTQEHVTALVAWFWAEGGDIANSDIFNPLNTGLNNPALLASANDTSGVQSFKSFDAGVEALVISFTGSNQNRIASVLSNPTTTANQVIDAVTYYQNYAGNKAWATADIADQVGYHNGLLANVAQARTNYTTEASTILGTPDREELQHKEVSPSLLVYGSNTAVSTTTSSPAAVSSNGCSVATPSTGSGYHNPFHDTKTLIPGRIDQGVDYGLKGPDTLPIYAIGAGKVVEISGAGWPGGVFIAYQLSDGKAAGKYIYVAEDCTPAVGLNDPVTADTVLCYMYVGPSGIETGWAQPPSAGDVAMAHSEYHEGLATSFGQNFSQLLGSLGGPAGVLSQSSGVSNVALPPGWPTW